VLRSASWEEEIVLLISLDMEMDMATVIRRRPKDRPLAIMWQGRYRILEMEEKLTADQPNDPQLFHLILVA
jgi:hypothetical protein